ncbi:hypothetical protein [Rhodococcoides yunnanense]|uniref:hypothetical protein n=1 Tax=Rhodococcoides yunnanense TaxID=278209 RepID=UPI0022B208ED|nr:hypothetical protein [Rhodococcus yunnanensis]MCZ4274874.1 hypothetical protein [Rhodococcus yunnanensis]
MSNPGQPGNEHQPDWQRWEAEHSAHAFGKPAFDAPPPPRPAPVDVETARHLWWGVAGLGVMSLVLTLLAVSGARSVFAQQLIDDVRAQDASLSLTLETAEGYLIGALVVMFILGVGFAALFVYWVEKMRHGRMWARTVLTMIGTVTVVMALPQLFAFGVDGGAVSVLAGVAAILQGVLAAGAIYLMHRKESNKYFVASRTP